MFPGDLPPDEQLALLLQVEHHLRVDSEHEEHEMELSHIENRLNDFPDAQLRANIAPPS